MALFAHLLYNRSQSELPKFVPQSTEDKSAFSALERLSDWLLYPFQRSVLGRTQVVSLNDGDLHVHKRIPENAAARPRYSLLKRIGWTLLSPLSLVFGALARWATMATDSKARNYYRNLQTNSIRYYPTSENNFKLVNTIRHGESVGIELRLGKFKEAIDFTDSSSKRRKDFKKVGEELKDLKLAFAEHFKEKMLKHTHEPSYRPRLYWHNPKKALTLLYLIYDAAISGVRYKISMPPLPADATEQEKANYNLLCTFLTQCKLLAHQEMIHDVQENYVELVTETLDHEAREFDAIIDLDRTFIEQLERMGKMGTNPTDHLRNKWVVSGTSELKPHMTYEPEVIDNALLGNYVQTWSRAMDLVKYDTNNQNSEGNLLLHIVNWSSTTLSFIRKTCSEAGLNVNRLTVIFYDPTATDSDLAERQEQIKTVVGEDRLGNVFKDQRNAPPMDVVKSITENGGLVLFADGSNRHPTCKAYADDITDGLRKTNQKTEKPSSYFYERSVQNGGPYLGYSKPAQRAVEQHAIHTLASTFEAFVQELKRLFPAAASDEPGYQTKTRLSQS